MKPLSQITSPPSSALQSRESRPNSCWDRELSSDQTKQAPHSSSSRRLCQRARVDHCGATLAKRAQPVPGDHQKPSPLLQVLIVQTCVISRGGWAESLGVVHFVL